jgi:hypothetical protein
MASPVRRIPGPTKICYDCDHELYPNGKIIFDDPLAKQDNKGRWHCSDCQVIYLGTYSLNPINNPSVIRFHFCGDVENMIFTQRHRND